MTVESIEFNIENTVLKGELHLPDKGCDPFPGFVMTGPMTSVKEQVTGVYAAALAKRGYAALAFDPRHYGESGGEPRQYEYYPHKIADTQAAFRALGQHPAIDASRLGLFGICLGCGYALHASLDLVDVRLICAIVGYYRDVPAMRTQDPEGFASKVQQGIDARELYQTTGEVETIPAAALSGDAAMTGPALYEYYATPRAGVANYTNAFAVMSREYFLNFDVQSVATEVRAPVAMVHGRKALPPQLAEQFYQSLTTEKSLHWIEQGENQTQFYDDPALINAAFDYLSPSLDRYLPILETT